MPLHQVVGWLSPTSRRGSHVLPINRRINLTFHGIGAPGRPLPPGEEEEVWITPEWFGTVLDEVQDRGDAWLSFDDGNSSDVRRALPQLRERNLQATFFVLAGKLGAPGFLSEDELLSLVSTGMKVGSHGMYHRCWRDLDDATLYEELATSKLVLEHLVGQPVVEASCPFGSYDRRVLKALQACGYRRVFTSDDGFARPDGWLQPRNTVTRRFELDRLKHTRARTRPAHSTMRGVKLAVKRWR